MGADHRLFGPQRAAFADVSVPPWPLPARGELLEDYASRMASTLQRQPTPYFVGVSFGGMVALEVARHMPAKGVFVISSCLSGDAIRPVLRTLGACVSGLPFNPFRFRRMLGGTLLRLCGDLGRAHRELLLRMLVDSDPRFLRWACASAARWSFSGQLPAPVVRIHGSRDRIIPIDRVRPNRVVPGAGHFLNLTHADALNSLMLETIRTVESCPDDL
jgi:pimeloyl-ACP methyl ester carboxylesterase